MVQGNNSIENESSEIITSTIFCVNTKIAYVYELLNGNIVHEKRIAMNP